jgi:molecular chaperone DnaK (HSP70)
MANFLKEFTHVIAIDFGTGESGYAIVANSSNPNTKPIIEVFNPCDDNDQKTPTAILFDNNKNFLDFGSNAIRKYAEIVDNNNTALLFQNYKISLYHMQSEANSMDGRSMPLMTVISETLKYIAKCALNKLSEQVGETLHEEKIRWVLTVPALWNEEHKLFMRKAAVKAGIIQDENSFNLLLCLEPEGASIQVREDSEEALKKKITKGSIIVVLDCGGGTVDITINKMLCDPDEKFLSNEVLSSTGGCEWGSKYVDANFENFLKEFLGEKLFAVYQKNASMKIDILDAFEILKKKFNPESVKHSRLQLSYLGENLTPDILKNLVNNYNLLHPDTKVSQRGSSGIDLSNELMISFFEPLINRIINKVKELLEETKQKAGYYPKFIFLVGGFGESPYLRQKIKKEFESNQLIVLIPKRPLVSVVRGACMFGLNPFSITSRIAKKTYGISTLGIFDEKKHPSNKKVMIDGEAFCENIFDAFVLKDESVSVNQEIVKTYCPVRGAQTIMKIILYYTDKREVNYIDEEGVEKFGELIVNIGEKNQGIEDKLVTVSFLFGNTQIYVIAKNKNTGDVKKCEFKFDSD